MAAIAFDPLEYTRALEASGVPREQAEVHAKAMTATFIHNFDALVTRDYLDTRFTEFEARITAGIDKRFVGVDKQFAGLDKQFAQIDKQFVQIDKRFAVLEAKMQGNFSKIYMMFGLVLATTTIPILQNIFGSLG